MKKLPLLLPLLGFALSASAQQKNIYHKNWVDFNKNGRMDVFEDPSQNIEKRIGDLLGQMTVEEKTCQMATLYGYKRVLKDEMPVAGWKNEIWKDGIANIDEELNNLTSHTDDAPTQYSYPFSKHASAINTIQKWFVEETRMGIPVDFTNEGIHGLNHDRATPLPAPIGIGSTWDKQLVRRAGQTVGREAKALGYTNIYAPILDPARDQRWGRVVECYGENPFLIAEMGKQMVLGIQEEGVASTLKHYAVYSVPKGGRDGSARTDPHVAPREMHQIYLYPFRRVIQEAHPMGVMSSYNDWDGVPVTGSYYFLTELLRQKFGFQGYVVSDSEAVEYLYSKHKVAIDYKEAVRQAVEAGLNVRTNFTMPQTFVLPLRELIKENKISMKTIDSRVADVLRVKFRLGLFDNPYVKDPKAADKIVHTKTDAQMSLQMNRESMVLLKNENNLLPLDKSKYKNILVTGPLAVESNYAISRYGPSHNPIISALDGIKNYVGTNSKVSYTKGCDMVDATWPESEIIETPLTAQEQAGIDSAVAQARLSDVVIAVVGEDVDRVGESLSRTGLNLPGRQLKLIQALQATGKPVVMVMINGQPLTINWENKYVPAILEAWFPSVQSGQVIAETLFGDNNPGGKLPITFPKTTGQIEFNFPFKPNSQAGQGGANSWGKTSVNGALYPFGYGLSYTKFEYSTLQVSPQKGQSQGDVTVTVDVTNTGQRKGDDVVQLYLKDDISTVTTYEYDLRGFERVSLNPGEKKTVTFTLHPDDLALLDKNMNWTVEPGTFQVWIGASSEDIKLKKGFTVE
ncbi:glycoside hydrolase family 3 N-terminal domain-containing protein [Mucilaginibacter phyllosphaerae]|uniref:Beta-glucosidase n=1 Tax=Mucilaginibacter phyllosphaerae TaxID=1812349 RepID=A0A4Y8AJA9_9SPHI|nr:glycoside hydrolase family 3 N-terminal domain-containing protein [Mucilaginibacter phyllosphaerae]MBB3967846.1 beta-glucosidase [Mucilaginibacter phyllosphaerae]TEW69110.1 beta-glucosidase [Mucilaginibacter phyllosphaerae]GGH02897.1 beta-glucosidase [Mucilaginibacter phyllosphaerae]